MEVNHKVEEESSDLPSASDARINKKKNDSPSISDNSDDDSSSESSDAPKLPPKPVKPRRSRTSMLASFGTDINDAGKVSSVFTALDEREAAEQERKRQEKEAKRLKREKLRQERERKQMEREEKSQRETESEQKIKSNEDTNDGSLPPIRDVHDDEQPKQARTSDVPNGDVRSNAIAAKTDQTDTNGELPRKKRKYVRKPKEEAEDGKEKKRRRKDSEDTKPRKKRRKESDENTDEKDKEVTKKKRRRKESNGEEDKPKRRKKKNNNNTAEERSEEEPKKKRRKKKKEDDVSHDKSDSANSTKKPTRKRKPKRENSKKSEAENEKSESDTKARRASKDDDESSESGEEWTLIEEDLLPGDTLTIFSKQVFGEVIKKHAKTAAARALDRGYGYPMVPFPKYKPKYQPRKNIYECFSQFAANNQIATPAPLVKGRKDFRIPYGAEYASDHSVVTHTEEDDKRLNGSRKIQHPKKRLLSHLMRTNSDGSKQSDLVQDEVDSFVKINTAESM